ncbi:MAG TPA: class I SAM-dependent methyltransferase [Bacteroidetes bacterium]|nr:class I SAM-dependent methyltransferase [Bacteroidota bacterium]
MKIFDKIAKEWDLSSRRVLLAKNTFEAIEKKVPLSDQMELIDIGTGTGLLLINFVDKVKHITGVDNSAGMLEILKNKLELNKINNVSLKLFEADTEILPENRFDLAISNMTFHHIIKPSSFLKHVYSSLKPGGKICIADLETEDGTFHKQHSLDGVHHFGFDKQVFSNWLQEANFKNTTIETIFEIDKEGRKFPVFLAYGEKI